MKSIITLIAFALFFTNGNAQLLRRIKEKAEQTLEKKADKPAGTDTEKKAEQPKTEDKNTNAASNESNNSGSGEAATKKELKVFSKFDFVPGSSILYFDNFEKDNTGETPLGWITSKSAEVVTLEGLEGNWVKLSSTLARHISRNKKQSWGNNFTIEFDMLIVKKDYDPRMGIALINSNGKMVTDEAMLLDNKPVLLFESIIVAGGKSRISLTNRDAKVITDNMSEDLPYDNTTPVHISICVQGKRFRMWWNEKKLYDMSAINEEYLPNQFGFTFGSVGGSEFYVSNFRVAKDVPDTRAKFEQGKIVSNLLFYTGTSSLKPESMGALFDVSKVLKEVTSPVKIIGHTDSDGDDASNQKLSQQRAETIKSILAKQYGIDESLLSTEGRGETQPIADNKNAEGKAQNRRVEFIFKPEADVYTKPAGIAADNPKPAAGTKPAANAGSSSSNATGVTTVKLQSKILTVNFPFAQIMKTGENTYTFMAGKEEGNSKQNYFKIEFETVNMSLKPETFNFKEINQKNALYGTKKFSEIKKTEAVLYYGTTTSPYIYKFSPIIANGHMASFVTESLERKLPAASANCKFVIEKVEGGMASGYFVFGIMNKGLKPITKGDAMAETFTDGFAGDMKCTFTNVPVN
jgi:outer membrane protein OmpA-like peptidoglycan-associated protein